MKKSYLTKKIVLSIILVFMFFMNFSVMKNVKADDVDDTQIVNNDYEETTELDDTTTDETEVVNTALPVFNNEQSDNSNDGQSDNSNDVQQDDDNGEPVVVVDGSDGLEVDIVSNDESNNQIQSQPVAMNNKLNAPLLSSGAVVTDKVVYIPAGQEYKWSVEVKSSRPYYYYRKVLLHHSNGVATFHFNGYGKIEALKDYKIGPFSSDTSIAVNYGEISVLRDTEDTTDYYQLVVQSVSVDNNNKTIKVTLIPESTITLKIKKIWSDISKEEIEKGLLEPLQVDIVYIDYYSSYDVIEQLVQSVTLSSDNQWYAEVTVDRVNSGGYYVEEKPDWVLYELDNDPNSRGCVDGESSSCQVELRKYTLMDEGIANTTKVIFKNRLRPRTVVVNAVFLDADEKPLKDAESYSTSVSYESQSRPGVKQSGKLSGGYLWFYNFPANIPGFRDEFKADNFRFIEQIIDKNNKDVTSDFFITYSHGSQTPEQKTVENVKYIDLPVSGYILDRSLTITNIHKKTTSYTVTKKWDDFNDEYDQRPERIMVQLYQQIDGGEFTAYGDPVELNADKSWTYTWEDIHAEELNQQGEKTENVAYYAEEVEIPGDNVPGDGQQGDNVLDNYEAKYSYSKTEASKDKKELTITNKLVTEHYTVTKVWEDYNNELEYRPEHITVQLYKLNNDNQLVELGDPVSFGEDDVVEGHKWSHRWTNLPIAGVYYAKELDVSENPFYEVSYSLSEQEIDENHAHLTITNKLKIEKDKYKVDIKWDDLNDKYEIRPDEVTVQLYRKQAPVRRRMMLFRAAPPAVEFEPVGEPVTVSAADNWSHEWDLPTTYMNEDGVSTPIAYYVKQGDINKNYLASYSPLEEEVTAENRAVTITNTLDTVEVSVNKIWDDNNNKAGVRPESVTVRLLADGKKTDETVTLTGRGSWKNIFTGLLKYNEEDKEIVYTVQEAEVKGYTSKVDGYTITNTYTPLPDGEDSGGVTTRTYTVPKTGVE